MSATSSPGAPGLNDPALAGPDPSMDEILASIRRILNEDALPASEPPPATHGVLMLDSSMLVNEDPMTAEAAPHPDSAASIPAATSYEPPAHLVAPEAAAAASSSVGELVRTLASSRSTSVSRDGPTIEDLVRDEIRPVLKTWLDQHLPPIVERLVRVEIERVISRMAP